LIEERNKDGTVKRDEFGRPKKKQRGDSLLYKEFGVRKQLLDDPYIGFIRLAEERIGETADYGVISYISNSSYLPIASDDAAVAAIELPRGMDRQPERRQIPHRQDHPEGPGAGTRDDSAFTTEMDPRGIQPGTAIVTWVKRTGARTKADNTAVLYRDFWGPAAGKRQGLLASLPAGLPPKVGAGPVYEPVKPSQENRWRLAPKTVEGGFEAWPGLDEIFPVAVQGVNHNRGIDGSVIDTAENALAARMKAYINARTFEAAATRFPSLLRPELRKANSRSRDTTPKLFGRTCTGSVSTNRKFSVFLRFRSISASSTTRPTQSCLIDRVLNMGPIGRAMNFC
jgi:hypothetical protein